MHQDNPDRVKRAPRRWEQRLLTLAMHCGGQDAVDDMARRISDHNLRVGRLMAEAKLAPWQDRVWAFERIRDSGEGLAASLLR